MNKILKEIPCFSELSTRNQSTLAKVCLIQQFNSDQQIVAQNTRSQNVYFILSGKVRAAYNSPNKRDVILYENSEGDICDIFYLANKKIQTPRITAITPVTVISIPHQEFSRVLQNNPAIALQLNIYLMQLLCSLSERIIEFNLLDVNSRVQAELLRLASNEEVQNNKVTISSVPTHAEIASRISSHREAVTRELKRLELKSLIRRKSRTLTILDLNRFKRMLA